MQGIYNYLAARLLNSFYVGRFTLIIQLKLTCISDFFAIWIKLFTCKDLLIHASTVHELLFPLSSVFPLLSTNCFLLVATPQCPNCFSLFQKILEYCMHCKQRWSYLTRSGKKWVSWWKKWCIFPLLVGRNMGTYMYFYRVW